jgi:acyl dehydratase
VRFPAPVLVGSRVRGSFRVESVDEFEGGFQATMTATVERDGGDKPVCVAELVFRYYG